MTSNFCKYWPLPPIGRFALSVSRHLVPGDVIWRTSDLQPHVHDSASEEKASQEKTLLVGWGVYSYLLILSLPTNSLPVIPHANQEIISCRCICKLQCSVHKFDRATTFRCGREVGLANYGARSLLNCLVTDNLARHDPDSTFAIKNQCKLSPDK